MADPGEGPAPLFLEQTGPKCRKNCFGDRATPYLRVWITAPPPPLSQGLDPKYV